MGKPTLMVVEDNPEIRDQMRWALADTHIVDVLRMFAGRSKSASLDLRTASSQEVSDLVRMLPGFRVTGASLDARVVSSRGRISILSAECVTNIVIDGMQRQEINLLRPSDLGAMEYYRGPSDAPPQYDSACGVIVLWTKR